MKKTTKISRRERSNKAGYLFLLPYALLFTIFILTPVCLAVVLSFTNFNVVSEICRLSELHKSDYQR